MRTFPLSGLFCTNQSPYTFISEINAHYNIPQTVQLLAEVAGA